jgi:hypothetical protein
MEEYHKLFWLKVSPALFIEGRRAIARIYQGPQAILINYAYLCPVCGEVWARMWHEPHASYDNSPPHWEALVTPCERHGGGLLIPTTWPLEFPFPLELLRHDAELLVHRKRKQ